VGEWRLLGAAALVCLLGGCAGYPTYERGLHVSYADDVGTVTVSQSGGVTDWDDVASELQPTFKMDSATALASAIPTTQSFDERLYDALTASLQVGLPTTTSSRTTKEVTDPETGELVTSVDNSRTRASGQAPAAAPFSPTGAAALAALGSQTLGEDPMLKYLAATALQQEVALLNRYVKDQVRWPGSQAFVVRLQLTVLPNARTMPYDIETDITLHSEDEQSRAGLALSSMAVPAAQGMTVESVKNAAGAIEDRRTQCAVGSFDTLQILPMIVTDNLEGLRAARATDNVRQLALALMGTAGNVGAAGQFGRTTEALRRAEGRDTNSLLTVAKLSDDTVRVRLGAVQSARYGHVMNARNHFVSLVVIVRPCVGRDLKSYIDDGPRTLTAVTRTNFRDGDTGQSLPYRQGSERLAGQIEHIQKQFVGQFNYLELARLYQWATRQDRERFFDYVVGSHLDATMCRGSFLKQLFVRRLYATREDDFTDMLEADDYLAPGRTADMGIGQSVPDSYGQRDHRCLTLARMRYTMVAAPLWTELQSMRPTGQFAFTNIPVTLRKRRPAVPPRQIALVTLTSGDSTVTVAQGRDMLDLREAQMVLTYEKQEIVPASTTSIAANGRSVTGTFAPLDRFGIKATEAPARPAPAPPLKGKAKVVATPLAVAAPDVEAKYALVLRVPMRNSTCPLNTMPEPTENPVQCRSDYPVRFADASKVVPSSPYGLDASASGIIANPSSGAGRLIVIVTAGKTATPTDKLRLSVEGAQIAAARLRDGTLLSLDGAAWKVPAAGEILLELENLIPNTVVKATLKDGNATAGSVSRSVVASVPTKSN